MICHHTDRLCIKFRQLDHKLVSCVFVAATLPATIQSNRATWQVKNVTKSTKYVLHNYNNDVFSCFWFFFFWFFTVMCVVQLIRFYSESICMIPDDRKIGSMLNYPLISGDHNAKFGKPFVKTWFLHNQRLLELVLYRASIVGASIGRHLYKWWSDTLTFWFKHYILSYSLPNC